MIGLRSPLLLPLVFLDLFSLYISDLPSNSY